MLLDIMFYASILITLVVSTFIIITTIKTKRREMLRYQQSIARIEAVKAMRMLDYRSDEVKLAGLVWGVDNSSTDVDAEELLNTTHHWRQEVGDRVYKPIVYTSLQEIHKGKKCGRPKCKRSIKVVGRIIRTIIKAAIRKLYSFKDKLVNSIKRYNLGGDLDGEATNSN